MNPPDLNLNDLQLALVKLMAAGQPVRVAAAELGISSNQAATHIWRARKANQVKTDQELVLRFRTETEQVPPDAR